MAMKKYTVFWEEVRIYVQGVTVKASSFADAVNQSRSERKYGGWQRSRDEGAPYCGGVIRSESKKGANDGKDIWLNDVPRRFNLKPKKIVRKGLDEVGGEYWANVEADEVEKALAVPKGRNRKAGLR